MQQDETLRTWGRNIKLRREALTADGQICRAGTLPMSQAELGAHLEPPVHQSTVARWEAGLMEPRRHYKAQLAHILVCDVSMLFPMTRSVA